MLVGVGLLTFVAGVMIAQLTAGMATRDALFLSHFAPTTLPYVMGIAAVLSLIVVGLFSRLLVRWSPDRVVPAAFAANAALFVGEWALMHGEPLPAAVMTYLHTMVLGAVLVSGFWTLMTETFDPHTAKRVFGRIGAGGSIGGVLGGIAANRAGAVVSMEAMLLFLAGLNVVAALALASLKRPSQSPLPSAHTPTGTGAGYLRLLAVLVVLTAVSDVSFDYVFKARAAAELPKQELIGFFALFYATAGVISFLLQALVARWLLQGAGLTGTLACQPVIAALGAIGGVLVPGLWPVTIVRAGDSALRTSLFKAGYELLYTPLPPEQKRAVKTKIDVGFSRLGGFTGSALVLLILAVSRHEGRELPILLGIAAISSVVAVVLVGFLHRGYVRALADSLVHAAIKLDPEDVEDATTRTTLAMTTMGLDAALLRDQIITLRRQQASAESADDHTRDVAALQSADIARVRGVLAHENLEPRLAGFIIPLLTREELVDDATRSLRKLAPRITGQLIDALLDPASPGLVRRRIPRILVASPSQRSVDGLVSALVSNDSFDVHHRCALALERITQLEPTLVIERDLILEAVRAELGRLGGNHDRKRLEQVFLLLGLVLDRRPLKLAHRALSSEDTALRGTGLEYMENVMPERIFAELRPHLGSPERRAKPRLTSEIVNALVESMPGIDLGANVLDDEPP